MGFGAKLDGFAQLRGILFLFLLLDSGFSSEQIDGGSGREKSLMLLPLQRLTQKSEETRWRDDADFSRQRLSDGGAALVLSWEAKLACFSLAKEI